MKSAYYVVNAGRCLVIFYLIIILLGCVGWWMNLENLFAYDVSQTKWLLSLIGVFVAPLGAITGWLW